ncbi:serine/threonine-protein kinase [Roseateles saccharophilus]|uniref:Serine/threonine-protein kinase n=1 Tax=Roseateles saccharophilus TaxID=304 RepID=A0A4R3V2E0_ROSSA|nr:serine/threonine-protein kinase [Roseateles saccharophilus]MDG0831966.1 serine/threonine protein kinase [Roseateles saccharophilus]TCU97368.1 serine/threonine-protein kinase [Roseateles saccharophilus]
MSDTKHPQQLGKYRITAVLGEGAMGVVYKGFDPDIQRTVALKTIRAQLDTDDDRPGAPASRFRNEAQAAGRLMHPGIVAVYDFGRDQQIAYIAMEYVEGRSLASYLSSKVRFTDTDIAGIMSQLLDALGHAHDKGVWHRDVKPANIIMTANGRLKVADFGIARIESTHLTQTHYMVGTPSHMAPEQFLGKPMDRRVDIYGAGVVLYQLLTGRAPFAGTTEALMYKVVNELPPPPSTIEGADRPGWFDAVIARALAKLPGDRFDTTEAFKQALLDGAGSGLDDTAWEKTLMLAPPRPAGPSLAPPTFAPPSAGSPSAGTPPPTHWDKAQLTQAELTLARHVGPLASVLVRRAARECADINALYARLAEQVSDPRARDAFLGQASLVTGGSVRTAGGTSGTPSAAGSRALAGSPGATTLGGPLNEAVIDKAQALLAQHVGPIAKVLVKRAAAGIDSRAVFFNRLAEAVNDAKAREKLLADLARLR